MFLETSALTGENIDEVLPPCTLPPLIEPALRSEDAATSCFTVWSAAEPLACCGQPTLLPQPAATAANSRRPRRASHTCGSRRWRGRSERRRARSTSSLPAARDAHTPRAQVKEHSERRRAPSRPSWAGCRSPWPSGFRRGSGLGWRTRMVLPSAGGWASPLARLQPRGLQTARLVRCRCSRQLRSKPRWG